jgi:hypothetical protein
VTTHSCAPRTESERWFNHFSLRNFTALYVSRSFAPQLSAEELAAVTKSIQQFQLGEASRGERLLKRGQEYGRAANDPVFAEALKLFIKEEQQHSRYLANFMHSQGIPLLSRHWVDSVFRKLRGLAGLELSLAVLVTAELIAVPYYRALRDATRSHVLKIICTRILEDEAAHLRYQSSMLAQVAAGRPHVWSRALARLHRLFLLGTIFVVWVEHQAVFEAGGYDLRRFTSEALFEFTEWETRRQLLSKELAIPRTQAVDSLAPLHTEPERLASGESRREETV